MSVDHGIDVDPTTDAPPRSGLAPASQLADCVDELNALARGRCVAANEEHALLVVYTAPTRSASERERYLTAIHDAIRAAMPAAEVVAQLGERAVATIVSREPRSLCGAVRSLNAQIDVAVWENRLPTTHVCIEPVPASGRKLAALYRDL